MSRPFTLLSRRKRVTPKVPTGHVNWPVIFVCLLVLVAVAVWILRIKLFGLSTPPKPLIQEAPAVQQTKTDPVLPQDYVPGLLPVISTPTVEAAPVSDPVAELLKELKNGQTATLAQLQIMTKALQDLNNKPVPVGPTATPVVTTPKETPEATRQRAQDKRQALQEQKTAKEAREREAKTWKPISLAPKDDDKDDALRSLGPYALKPGHYIPIILEAGATTDAVAPMKACVSETVYDSDTHTIPLIPQGACVIGSQEGTVLPGDARMKTRWTMLVLPGRDAIKLGSIPGLDQSGRGGFVDKIDAHWGRLFASVVLTGVLRGGTSVMTGGYGGDISQRVGSAVVMEGANQGQQTARQFINTSPTIEISPGYQATLLLTESIAFPGPYVGVP